MKLIGRSPDQAARAEDLTGRRFGRLTIESIHESGRHGTKWLCLCDCGKSKIVYAHALRTGRTVSCGCYHDECSRNRRKHGESGTALYGVWSSMKDRCLNRRNPHFKNYGGRGITVCKRWLKYENFLADMGQRPEGMTIERKDNDGPYAKWNCRWATRIEQQANRRSGNRLITANGRTLSVAEWARLIGMKYETLYGRIYNGWPVARALSENVR